MLQIDRLYRNYCLVTVMCFYHVLESWKEFINLVYLILGGFMKFDIPILRMKIISRLTTGELHLSNAMPKNTMGYGCLQTGKKNWSKPSCPGENDENLNLVSFWIFVSLPQNHHCLRHKTRSPIWLSCKTYYKCCPMQWKKVERNCQISHWVESIWSYPPNIPVNQQKYV